MCFCPYHLLLTLLHQFKIASISSYTIFPHSKYVGLASLNSPMYHESVLSHIGPKLPQLSMEAKPKPVNYILL